MTTNVKVRAVGYFLLGIKLIFKSGIRQFVWIPIAINTLLFSLASWLLWEHMAAVLNNMLPTWLEWLSWFLIPIFSLIILVIVYFCFTLFANIIAAPFYNYLARRVESDFLGDDYSTEKDESLMVESLAIMGSEIRKVLYYLLRAVPLLMLSIIPGLNIITLPLWFIFSAWFLAFEYTGYYFENHQILFQQQKHLLKEDKLNIILFGSLCLLFTSIPILNLFIPAIAVAGATRMQLDN
ncbi:MAG: sulfate transporter CysZ [Piscirickettsiaceae bacterium]|nr:MAG: sulfate transporter CysZ [Piscirickettsiaceae bacterium]